MYQCAILDPLLMLQVSCQAESSRLLYEDPYQNYGAFQNQQTTHGAYQPDPEDLKREQEALDAICQRTSEYDYTRSWLICGHSD